ncbi:helix-turn-helix domain-containing protein [Kineosporia succinea]|uniref:Transcriptional regulator with XRE-family HTH domain n=1 Tax=Kineosporia succinea TaxID=84632 RepID=A0ABT9PAI1_9ACTN|nr:XRE family transcriptional regulator [Kineosporia succinea]MDP9829055.1 transcriptional regulator with XRE-family HTH domain [Kineosporia succinea]
MSEPPNPLGARIRRVRRSRGLTLAQLAVAAGLTHGFLSKLERGLASPSMASLGRITVALGTSQVELLAGDERDVETTPGAPVPEAVHRAGEGPTGLYGLGRARLLTTGDRRLQPLLFEGENTDPGEFYQHAEDEFIHVTAGTVVVDRGPQGVVTLGPGDSLYLGGGTPHRWSTGGPEVYRLFIVKENPRASSLSSRPTSS